MNNIPLFQQLAHDSWVKPFFKRYRWTLALAIFLGFCTFFCAGALMFNSGYLISKSASLPENILLVYVPIVLTRAFGIGRPVFRYVERLVSHNWVLRMTSHLRVKLYKAVEQDAIFFKRKYRIGDVMGLLSEDINHIQNLYLRSIFPTLIAWLLYVVIVIGLGCFSLGYALLVALYFLLILLAMPLWSIMVNGARQSQEKTLKNDLYTDLTDNVLGIADWIFSQRGQEYVALHEQSQDKLSRVQSSMRKFNHLRDLLFQYAFGLLALLTLVWCSTQFIGNHGGAANWIAAFVLSIFPLVDAFAGLSAASQETNTYADSIERLNGLPEETEEQNWHETPSRPLQFDIQDLTFKYETKAVLNHLSMTIHAGEKVAILGRSGSGKSTLASLLRGDLIPSDGTILLGGVPVHHLQSTISQYIGVIQQEPYLFNTTILNNIRLGNEQASVEEVWDVLQRVGLKSMVEQLPDGLATIVDEAGLRFSGGERHRLALARILLQNTPIIILDEPTVGLDPITEQAVLHTFMHELHDKTLIWITHHLQGIEAVDRVLFIEDGQLEMQGSPEYLQATNPRYQRLKAIDDGD